MFKKLISWFLLVAFPCYVGCYSTANLTQDEFVRKKEHAEIVLVLKDLSKYRFGETGYTIQRDSLFGRGLQILHEGKEIPFRGAIALSDIEFVQTKEQNTGLTILAVGAGIVVILGVVSLIFIGDAIRSLR